jgi:hypothetical protein
MSDIWNRATFRPGQAANYDELTSQEEQASEGGRARGDDGRGEAGMGGAPRPVPGDDLYAALVFAREKAAEKDHRAAIVAARDDGFSLLAWAAAARLAAGHEQPEQGNEHGSFQSLRAEQAEIPVHSESLANEPGEWRAAADEVTRSGPAYQGQAPVASKDPTLRDGPTRPASREAPDGLLRDFVSAETLAEVQGEWTQRAQQRDRSAGLAM